MLLSCGVLVRRVWTESRAMKGSGQASLLRRRLSITAFPPQRSTWPKWVHTVNILIAANAAVFLMYQQANYEATSAHRFGKRQWLRRHMQADLDNWNAGRYHSLILHSFSHQQISHFAFNMLSLHVFGSLVRQHLGSRVLLAVYCGAAATSGLAHIALQSYHQSTTPPPRSLFSARFPVNSLSGAIGASGAIMGIGAIAAIRMPTVPIYLYGILPVPLWGIMAAFTSYDLYSVMTERQKQNGVGHTAHLGGAAFGIASHLFLRR